MFGKFLFAYLKSEYVAYTSVMWTLETPAHTLRKDCSIIRTFLWGKSITDTNYYTINIECKASDSVGLHSQQPNKNECKCLQ